MTCTTWLTSTHRLQKVRVHRDCEKQNVQHSRRSMTIRWLVLVHEFLAFMIGVDSTLLLGPYGTDAL
jgi:hypothetical protein